MAKGSTTATRGPTTAADLQDGERGADRVAAEIEAGGGDNDLDLEDRPAPERTRTAPRLDDEDERDRKPAGIEYEPDPRAALAKSFAERRKVEGREQTPDYEEEDEDEAGDTGTEGDGSPEVQIVAGPGAREVAQPPAQERRVRTDLQPDDLVVIKVDGADVQMTYAEMQALAQKNRAADARLDEAKTILGEVRNLQRTLTNPAAAPANEQRPGGGQEPAPRPAPVDKTKVDRDRIAQVVDEIQTATPEKAAEALGALLEDALAAGGKTSQPDVQSVVRQTIANEQADNEARQTIGAAYNTTMETFGDVLDNDNPDLANYAFGKAVDTITAALRAAGTPDGDFAHVAAEAARKGEDYGLALMRTYTRVQRDPRYADAKLPSVETVFTDVAKGARKMVTGDYARPINDKGKPFVAQAAPRNGGEQPNPKPRTSNAPVVVSSERRDRKTGMTIQPRSASMRTDLSARSVPTRKNTSATIAEMAASRK